MKRHHNKRVERIARACTDLALYLPVDHMLSAPIQAPGVVAPRACVQRCGARRLGAWGRAKLLQAVQIRHYHLGPHAAADQLRTSATNADDSLPLLSPELQQYINPSPAEIIKHVDQDLLACLHRASELAWQQGEPEAVDRICRELASFRQRLQAEGSSIPHATPTAEHHNACGRACAEQRHVLLALLLSSCSGNIQSPAHQAGQAIMLELAGGNNGCEAACRYLLLGSDIITHLPQNTTDGEFASVGDDSNARDGESAASRKSIDETAATAPAERVAAFTAEQAAFKQEVMGGEASVMISLRM